MVQPKLLTQVQSFIAWVAYLSAIGYSMQDALWINVDEIPLKYHYGTRKGMRKKAVSPEEKSICRTKHPHVIANHVAQ